MKKYSGAISAMVLALLYVSLSFGISSCTKEKTVIETDTLVVRDTIIKRDTIIPEPVRVKLTDHAWKLEEIRVLQSNTTYYYLRGGSNNTFNYDNEYIKFNTDFTGEYFSDGNLYTLTWAYKNEEKTKVEYTVAYPVPLVVNWENIEYFEDYYTYSEYYIKNGANTLSTAKRIPK